MANESEWTYAASVALETSGATNSNSVFSAAADSTLSSSNHSNYPYGDFVLYAPGFSANLGSNKTVNLYRRDLDIAGGTSNDAEAPASSNKQIYVGSFLFPDVAVSSTAYYISLTDVPLTSVCTFYIENQLGATLTSGWTLTVAPKAFVPGS